MERMGGREVLAALKGKLVVSCQASPGDPLEDLDTLRRIATAVLLGGAGGLRAEGAERVAAFRALTALPILGLVKGWDAAGEVHITPDFACARAVSQAGADIVALDCTQRRLVADEPWPALIARIHAELGRSVCADIATLEEAAAAEAAGADMVATTLHGYTAETAGANTVDWNMLATMLARVKVPVVLEGHVGCPAEVRRALGMGVHTVVVGSAITRPQTITARFVAATHA